MPSRKDDKLSVDEYLQKMFKKLDLPKPSKSKYKAKPTTVDGIRFHSKSEATMYSAIKKLQQGEVITHFFMQTPIHLPGGIKYVLDFMLFYPNGDIRYIDCKGTGKRKIRTPTYLLKKKQVEALYPIKIEEDL